MEKKNRSIDDKSKKLKKQEIINQTLMIFNESSYQDIKIDDIAQKANVAKGTVFLYFKTKESLFLEITIQEFRKLFESFNLNLKKISDLKEKNTTDDFILFLKTSFSECTNCKTLFRLISITNVILEQNSDYETTKDFKIMLYNNLLEIGTKFEKCFQFIPENNGIGLLLNIYALIIGYHNITDSSRIAKEVIEKENLPLFNLDFDKCFFSAIKQLLQGL